MKKKLIYLIGAVVLLIFLIVLYIYSTKKETNLSNDTAVTKENSNKAVSLIKDNANEITIKNQKDQYTVTADTDSYTVIGYENNSFSQSNLKYLFSAMSDLSAVQLVEENAADMSKYGLFYPAATAEIKGETITMLNIGNATPDSKYQYVSLNKDKNVYMITKGYADLVLRNLSDIIERNVTDISAKNVSYVHITAKNNPEILIDTDSNNESLKNYVSTSGLSALVMHSPIKDAIVYPTNMQDSLLCNLSATAINSVVELKPADLSKYGLNNPSVTVEIRDSENSLVLIIGNDADSNNVYAMIKGKPEVYTITKDLLSPFTDINIMDFVQNFVSLYARSSVNNITLKFGNTEHKIEFKTEGENKIAVDEEGVKRDNRNAYINNKLIDKSKFGDFYESLVGIGFDSVRFDMSLENKKPDMVITYNLVDGKNDIVNYYNYDANFYYVKDSINNSILMVNKQQINQLLNQINELTK